MLGCDCFYWKRSYEYDLAEVESYPFSLPAPLPDWPQGQGFASGRVCLGEIEVLQITKFANVWSCKNLRGKSKGVAFYKPVGIPDDFFCLGHYCQLSDQPLWGYVLVARDVSASKSEEGVHDSLLDYPALKKPHSYTLVWSTEACGRYVSFWLPNPPSGYKAMGIVVSERPDTPSLEEVRCVRADLTEACEAYDMLLNIDSSHSDSPFQVWSTRPCKRGMLHTGVPVGTFSCGCLASSEGEPRIACLKNLDPTLHSMPNLSQIHALIQNYGPNVYFHPDEVYLPSSVPWFFENGALLYREGQQAGQHIDSRGLNLPSGGENDGEFWIDLPYDEDKRNNLKRGNLESAELYVHVKPALGGAFTDIVMWVFCPFNGPATIKVGLLSIDMNRIGEHVSDWEHFTLRISNFTGELWSVYFSQHDGGTWLHATDLEYIQGNKPIVYSSKGGHASFPRAGNYILGPSKLGIGVRNDAAPSHLSVDSSQRYQIIAAEYLGHGVVTEPSWLQYMREWGPTILYDDRAEVEKLIKLLPVFVRFSVEMIFELFPTEIYGEEGPTGPKEKDNWAGDERW